jgi:hypothetical protein
MLNQVQHDIFATFPNYDTAPGGEVEVRADLSSICPIPA